MYVWANLINIYHIEIIFNEYICSKILKSCWYNLYLILKPSGPVQQYFFHLWSKMNGNQLLDWLRDIWFMGGLQISFCKNKQTNKQTKKSVQPNEVGNMTTWWTREAGNQAQGRKIHWQIKIFLHRGINTLHKFLCTYNSICVHVTCAVVSMHTICGGLLSLNGNHNLIHCA